MTKDNKDNYFDNGSFARDIKDPAVIFMTAGFTTLFSLTIGTLGMGIGVVIDENLPLDDTPRAGQDQALEQYDVMLSTLATEYDALKQAQEQVSNTNNVPSTFREYSNAQEEEDYAHTKSQLAQMNREFSSLISDFSTASLIDPRLNEDDVRDIFDDFETRVGDYTELSGEKTPDFGDLNHCRPDNINTLSSEFSTAKAVQKCSLDNPATNVNTATALFGVILPFLLLFGFLGKEWAQSQKGLNLGAGRKFNH